MDKLQTLLHSRKFWALIVALVGVLAGLNTGDIDTWQAVQAAVTALSAYSIGTGIEAAGQARVQPAPGVNE